MPNYKCPDCGQRYYSASKDVNKECEECGGKVEEES